MRQRHLLGAFSRFVSLCMYWNTGNFIIMKPYENTRFIRRFALVDFCIKSRCLTYNILVHSFGSEFSCSKCALCHILLRLIGFLTRSNCFHRRRRWFIERLVCIYCYRMAGARRKPVYRASEPCTQLVKMRTYGQATLRREPTSK